MSEDVTHTAGCCCGRLNVRLEGAPVDIYACACSMCQRASGAAFTYSACFPTEAVIAIEGPVSSWRRRGESGGWIENCFCPTCGSPVFGYAEGLPGVIQIAVGCLAEPDFAAPDRVYWTEHQLHWMHWPGGTRTIVGQ